MGPKSFSEWRSERASLHTQSAPFTELQRAYSLQVVNTELLDALKDLLAATGNWFVGGFPHASVTRANAVIEQAEQLLHESMASNQATENNPSPRNTIAQTTER